MKLHSQIPALIPSDLKYTNRFQVLAVFLDHGMLTANEVSAHIGLSRQTVMKAIQFFLARGLLEPAGKGASTKAGGKRPVLYALSRERYFVCISLWPDHMGVCLYTIGGQLMAKRRKEMALPADPREAVRRAGELARSLLGEKEADPERICAVSLSTAGIVDYGRKTLRFSSQSPEWGTDVPLIAYLRPYFGEKTEFFLENAGKMAAYPFLLEPQYDGKRMLTVFATWGLSSCLIEKNRILSGKNSLIGEIGHMMIDPHDPQRCGCGSHGCLERLISPERIRQRILDKREAFPDSVLFRIQPEALDLSEVFAASRAGDALGREISAGLARAFAMAFRNIALVFDPDYIIFQGDYAQADEWFDACLKEKLQEFQYFPADGPFTVQYDQRSLPEMEALGSYICLEQYYFGNPERYEEENAAEE